MLLKITVNGSKKVTYDLLALLSLGHCGNVKMLLQHELDLSRQDFEN